MYHPARLYPALWGMEKTPRRALSRKGLGSPLPAGVRPAPRVRERSRRRNMKKILRGKGVRKGKGKGKGWRFVLQGIIFRCFPHYGGIVARNYFTEKD